MMQADKFNIRLASWQSDQDRQQLMFIRTAVFLQEQQVPVDLEWDGRDTQATHLLAFEKQQQVAIGCVRILIGSEWNQIDESVASIGRMAVLRAWRSQGVGQLLLTAAMDWLQQQHIQEIHLSAQTHAIDFYAKFGFVVCSQPYLDAGIDHVDMQIIN